MPKPEGNRKKTKTGSKRTGRAKKQQLSASELFEQAQQALAYDDFDSAKDLLRWVAVGCSFLRRGAGAALQACTQSRCLHPPANNAARPFIAPLSNLPP